MNPHIEIRPFTEADFDDILRIANERLGHNYLSTTDLQIYTHNQAYLGLVALVNKKIAGFGLAQICSLDEVLKLALTDKEWFAHQFKNSTVIGVLKTIAVDVPFSNRGIGTALTNARVALLTKQTKTLLAISWQQKRNAANLKLLAKVGLTCKKSIANYWTEDSLQKHYTCAECGTPPCQCTALIYCN